MNEIWLWSIKSPAKKHSWLHKEISSKSFSIFKNTTCWGVNPRKGILKPNTSCETEHQAIFSTVCLMMWASSFILCTHWLSLHNCCGFSGTDFGSPVTVQKIFVRPFEVEWMIWSHRSWQQTFSVKTPTQMSCSYRHALPSSAGMSSQQMTELIPWASVCCKGPPTWRSATYVPTQPLIQTYLPCRLKAQINQH